MMWRSVLAIVAVGLLVIGLSGEALAKKPPIRGKGNPTQFGDPDWPAYCRTRDEKEQVAVKFWIEPVISDRGATQATQPGSVCDDWRKHRWPSLRYELRILGRTISIRR